MTIWTSGHVNRWHNNPCHALRNSQDTNWQHGARCAALLWRIWPNVDAHMIMAALLHDAAESVTGDMPATAKSGDLRDAIEKHEREYNYANAIPMPRDRQERNMLHLVDKLDAYLWARSVDPRIVDAPEWVDQIERVWDTAYSLGVANEVGDILDE